MAILSIVTDFAGQQGVHPRLIKLVTNDTYAVVTAQGYLNKLVAGGTVLLETDMAEVVYGDNETALLNVVFSGGNWTLATPAQIIPLDGTEGNFVNFSAIAGGLEDLGFSATDPDKTKVVMANGAVTIGRIACFTDTAGTIDDNAATAVNGGNIQAGLSGTAGVLRSYSSTGSKGYLEVAGVANTGDTATTVSNAEMGQATVVSIPDPGVATANFILSESAGTQSIASGNLAVSDGNLVAGASGAAGTVSSYPSAATSGHLALVAVASAGDYTATISNRSLSQSTTFSIGDPGQSTASILTSKVNADPGANLITVDVTVAHTDLASAASKTLYTSSGSKQFKIRGIWLNGGGTNFSGGGGDRLLSITDNTTVYSLIPAADLQTLANSAWGVTGLPFPAAAAINTSTAAGASIVAKYSGGAADYSAGSVVLTLLLERVA